MLSSSNRWVTLALFFMTGALSVAAQLPLGASDTEQTPTSIDITVPKKQRTAMNHVTQPVGHALVIVGQGLCVDSIFNFGGAETPAVRMAKNAVIGGSFPNAQIPGPCPLYNTIRQPIDWYARFLNGPEVKPLTPKEKAKLAAKNLMDPFNLLTIAGEAGISTASDSHSPYGPGIGGFGRNLSVSFTEDMTGQFFGTFLIPSLAHQDPHYHRMPQAAIARRVLHTGVAVVWATGDNGRGMLNYSTLAGSAIDAEIANLYVPGLKTNAPSTAARYGVGLATAPIDNLITEFLPDVASHIHVHVVFVQRIINTVANKPNAQ